jgi:DNA (cytosine-5)-methyltransferase 1
MMVKEDGQMRSFSGFECFRLMGFDTKDCQVLIDNGISNTQIYKMAGNSICVNVLSAIFTRLF